MSDKTYAKSLFIFRRDLRVHDNTALLEACARSDVVYTAFIFDPSQADDDKNEYFSERSFAFMMQSLRELVGNIKEKGGTLLFLQESAVSAVERLVKELDIEAVFVNEDNTPFAIDRDKKISEALEKLRVDFHQCQDYTLSPIRDIRTNGGKPYGVFTPFMNKAKEYEVTKPHRFLYENLAQHKTHSKLPDAFETYVTHDLIIEPGRSGARNILEDLSFLKDYKDTRNLPADHGTSRLSPHLKFGTVSVREVYHKIASQPFDTYQYIAELYWRDFYQHIAYHFPRVFQRSYLEWANNIEWVNDEKQFEAWKAGKTGVPMVDAGMRELNETGWMHNRSRMIVASYLTKNLLVDWRWGERYFAQQLIDYDPASNNGGWQWSASVGADPRPLRIFNPYTQAQKYDPDAKYIKQWIPELSDVDTELLTNAKEIDFSEHAEEYPKPLVDQKDTYYRAREVYKKAKEDLI